MECARNVGLLIFAFMVGIMWFLYSIFGFLKIFGRGGEEMDFLQQKGIQVKVIPGNSAPLLLQSVCLCFF